MASLATLMVNQEIKININSSLGRRETVGKE